MSEPKLVKKKNAVASAAGAAVIAGGAAGLPSAREAGKDIVKEALIESPPIVEVVESGVSAEQFDYLADELGGAIERLDAIVSHNEAAESRRADEEKATAAVHAERVRINRQLKLRSN